jgi:hypothetical protein
MKAVNKIIATTTLLLMLFTMVDCKKSTDPKVVKASLCNIKTDSLFMDGAFYETKIYSYDKQNHLTAVEINNAAMQNDLYIFDYVGSECVVSYLNGKIDTAQLDENGFFASSQKGAYNFSIIKNANRCFDSVLVKDNQNLIAKYVFYYTANEELKFIDQYNGGTLFSRLSFVFSEDTNTIGFLPYGIFSSGQYGVAGIQNLVFNTNKFYGKTFGKKLLRILNYTEFTPTGLIVNTKSFPMVYTKDSNGNVLQIAHQSLYYGNHSLVYKIAYESCK